MEKITDKYHRLVRPDDQRLNPSLDIKQVPKRTFQLGLAALFIGICISVYDAAIEMYVSSFLVACFCFAILLFMLLKYNDAIKDLTTAIISVVCGLLIFSACLEGLQSEQYLYFFPLLIAVPLLVDLKKTQYRKSAKFVTIIIFSFILCIIIGRYVRPMEDFTVRQVTRLAFVNRITAICTTIVFASLYTFFEKKYIDELVEQSNKVIDAKTQFLATMGHELRTPLNGIIGVVNLVKDESNTVKRNEYLQIIQSCSDHMLQQVNDILDFNKIEAGKFAFKPVDFNLRELLLNISTPFVARAREKNITFFIDMCPETNAVVRADDLRLTQIFNNLLTNALKFTDAGAIKFAAVCKKINERGFTVSFSIEDSGVGISKADQAMIFDSFWQAGNDETKQLSGTGLGLTICKRLLSLMGSSLNLESEKGIGSKFSFDLAFNYAERPAPPAKNEASLPGDLKGVKVLLVEDNEINMMVAKKILTGFKAAVTSAYQGREALDKMENDPDFHIVLMDLDMPVMNGYEAIYEMKNIYPKIPVVAITASMVDEQMRADLIASGFKDCVVKPYKPLELLTCMRKYL
ncbi:MAG TPA: ATP-binding protein [Mucilaginibacter sp.]|jgi:signal transduction histidine kinase/CheY-like chemotaxis protein|nr:ATP-binding protein [Mucilaginibacter sp.]